MTWFYSVRVQLTVALALCAAGTVALWYYFTSHQHTWGHWLVSWLIAVNVVTFAYYGIDKLLAVRTWIIRLPETVLHTLSAIGGSPAALLAMWLFRHKTIKPSFRIFFWVIAILQIILVAYIVKTKYWN